MSVDLHFNQFQKRCPTGETLFGAAESLGIQVPTSCRKQGKCKECLVEVSEGAEFLTPRTMAERHLRGNFRLACCTQIVSATGTVRCHTLKRGEMKIEKHALQLPSGSTNFAINPSITRDGDRILFDGVEIDCRAGPIYGLALDLGTTTVVLRLLNLETGESIADASFENPQRFGGTDVMARIQYDSEDGTHLLQRTLVGYLNHAIAELPADPEHIYEMVVAANSTMRDLFFRLDVNPIGQSPYQSVTEMDLAAGRRTNTSLSESAHQLGLHLNRKARVYGMPIISGHVGADAAAGMLAIELAHEKRLVALMDVGTNTELILGNKYKIFAASCPAGPAFEGGSISCGMPGLPGAIEAVEICADGSVRTRLIGSGPAQGICGSGLVDLLSELRRTEQINPLGRFEHGTRFQLQANGNEPLYLSEADINELAQAKGANVAGLMVVFAQYGASFEDLDVFYLAGGFGRHLNIASAKRIGLIPDIPNEKIIQVGNAAIEGACLALLSKFKRAELEALVRTVTHCRLEIHPNFFNYFVDGCQFDPLSIPSKPDA